MSLFWLGEIPHAPPKGSVNVLNTGGQDKFALMVSRIRNKSLVTFVNFLPTASANTSLFY